MKSILERLLRTTPVLGLSAVMLNGTVTVQGDGTEVLGPPAIPIAAGTGIVAAGTGLYQQPGAITLNVPAGSTVKQVLLYWEGDTFVETALDVPDTTIVVNGIEITDTYFSADSILWGRFRRLSAGGYHLTWSGRAGCQYVDGRRTRQ